MEWEFGVSKCRILYMGWISCKVLLYSTDYIQYPMINRDGKEYFKKRMYIYV